MFQQADGGLLGVVEQLERHHRALRHDKALSVQSATSEERDLYFPVTSFIRVNVAVKGALTQRSSSCRHLCIVHHRSRAFRSRPIAILSVTITGRELSRRISGPGRTNWRRVINIHLISIPFAPILMRSIGVTLGVRISQRHARAGWNLGIVVGQPRS